MNNLNKRLEALEAAIKSAAESPLWIDGHDNIIRLDINGKRGNPVQFPSVYKAGKWLEEQIDKHPGAAGSYHVDRIWELYRNPEQLRETIGAALEGRVIDVHGIKYSADAWPGSLFGGMKTAGPADLKLWLLAHGALAYFGTREFRARYNVTEFTDEDACMMCACYALFAWERIGASGEDFWRLVVQVCHLEAPQMPPEAAVSDAGPRSE